MNTIYLGPYRDNTINGVWSYNILSSLLEHPNHQVTCRPIYLESSNVSTRNPRNNDSAISAAEHTIQSTYDCLIQHIRPENIVSNKSLKNICIPIIDSEFLSHKAITNLKNCDLILVDNALNFQKLSTILEQTSNIELFQYGVDTNYGNDTYDFGPYSYMKKMYTIANYAANSDLYSDLLIDFIILTQKYENLCLVLFVVDSGGSIQEIQKIIDKTYESLNIIASLKKICIIPILPTIENLVSCHKICDMYLNINDDIRSTANSAYAYALDKPTIEHHNLSFQMTPIRNSKISKHWYDVPSNQSIMTAMQNILSNPTKGQFLPNSKSLELFL
jgi:hypothetical protein